MTELKPIRVAVNGKCPERCSNSGWSFIWGNYHHKKTTKKPSWFNAMYRMYKKCHSRSGTDRV